ncbi:hypothetical protein ACQPZA_05520 [Pseudonocardia xinjiangensis]|uniref:hypothetical protein n=1 Tax=Pseudonocardia xinjiangensis TaxID=75289 RepID=UPI003D8C892D
MDIGVLLVIVVVIVAVLLVTGLSAIRARNRRQEQQRLEAAEHRHEAEIRTASAERREAEAAERAAKARHEEARANEEAARAQQDREVAQERQAAADRIDPDVRGKARRNHDDADDGTPTAGAGAGEGADPAASTDRMNLDQRTDSPERNGALGRPNAPDTRDGTASAQGADPVHAGRMDAGEHGDPVHDDDPAARTDRMDTAADRNDPARGAGPVAGAGRMDAGEHGDPAHDVDPAARTDRMHFGERTDSPQTPAGTPQGADPAARTDRIPVGDQGQGNGPTHGDTRATAPVSGAGISGGAHATAGPAEVGGTEPGRPDVAAGPEGGRGPVAGGETGQPDADPVTSVPGQRSGEHDRPGHTVPETEMQAGDQCTIDRPAGEADRDRSDRSPVRSITDRLLGRNR